MVDDAGAQVQVKPGAWWAVAVVVAAVASQHRSLFRLADEVGISVLSVKVALAAIGAVIMWRYRSLPATWPAPGGRHRYDRLTTGTTSLMSAVAVLPVGALLAVVVAALANTTTPDQALPIDASSAMVFRDIVSAVVAPAFAEEAIYRLVLLGVLIRVMSPRKAVVVQAVVFTVAHTDLSLIASFAGPSANGYSLASSVGVAINGLLYGFLAVELGKLTPAITLHALHNLLVSTATIAPWLDDVVVVAVIAAAPLVAVRGLAGVVTGITPAKRRAAGMSPAFQNRLVDRAQPLIASSPEFRRPLYWVTPGVVDRLMAPRTATQ